MAAQLAGTRHASVVDDDLVNPRPDGRGHGRETARLRRYENAAPDKIWRHFADATGTLHITGDNVTCALNVRSHHPVLIDAGFADLQTQIPWRDGRTLRFRFPPR